MRRTGSLSVCNNSVHQRTLSFRNASFCSFSSKPSSVFPPAISRVNIPINQQPSKIVNLFVNHSSLGGFTHFMVRGFCAPVIAKTELEKLLDEGKKVPTKQTVCDMLTVVIYIL